MQSKYKHNHPEKEKICMVCGKTFMSASTIKIYCSKTCRLKHGKETYGKESDKYFTDREITYFQIFKRDNFRCVYCGKSVFQEKIKLVIDHIIPRSILLDNNITNLVTACKECNASKSASLLSPEIIEEIKMQTLKRTLEHKLEYAKLKEYFDNVFRK